MASADQNRVITRQRRREIQDEIDDIVDQIDAVTEQIADLRSEPHSRQNNRRLRELEDELVRLRHNEWVYRTILERAHLNVGSRERVRRSLLPSLEEADEKKEEKQGQGRKQRRQRGGTTFSELLPNTIISENRPKREWVGSACNALGFGPLCHARKLFGSGRKKHVVFIL